MAEEKLEENMRKIMNIAMVISVAVILVNVYLLHYVTKLESSCDCSKDWKRTFIKYFLYLTIALLLINLFGVSLGELKKYILVISGVLATINIIVIFLYIRQLKATKCDCSEGNARTLMEVINYFKLARLLFITILGAGLASAVLSIKNSII
jgi:hypothetical protein